MMGGSPNHQRQLLLPVIFTTATLYGTDADLSEGNVQTGEIRPGMVGATERPFLYYQYHLSPGIKHQATAQKVFKTLSSVLESEYIRTTGVVNTAGIEEFL